MSLSQANFFRRRTPQPGVGGGLGIERFLPCPFPHSQSQPEGSTNSGLQPLKTELDEIGPHFSSSQIHYSNLRWRSHPSTGNYEKLPVVASPDKARVFKPPHAEMHNCCVEVSSRAKNFLEIF